MPPLDESPHIDCRDAVGFVTIEAAPVFDGALLRALIAALARCESDPAVRSIVLSVARGGFGPLIAADPNDGHVVPDDARDHLLVLLERIDASTKRIYGALDGEATGAGLEILLACDAIYGTPASGVAFTSDAPVTPGSRVFERASALVPVDVARALTSGGRLTAIEAYSADLFDGIMVGDLRTDVAVFAKREAALPRGRYRAATSA